MTCQHFTYGASQSSHTMVGCNLRQKQHQQGEHPKKARKLWATTREKGMGWPPSAGWSARSSSCPGVSLRSNVWR